MKFSSPIEPPSFDTLLYYLLQSNENLDDPVRLLQRLESIYPRNLQATDDQASSNSEDESDKSLNLDDFYNLEQLLKVSGCVVLEYIPGQAFMAEDKTFSWRLLRFDSEGFKIELLFDNPDSISMNVQDHIKIVFNNTNFFMRPKTDAQQPPPNSFPIFFAVPPQNSEVLSEEAKDNTVTTTKGVLLTNLLMAFLFKNSMQLLFGSIISLQILAHLPLSNV